MYRQYRERPLFTRHGDETFLDKIVFSVDRDFDLPHSNREKELIATVPVSDHVTKFVSVESVDVRDRGKEHAEKLFAFSRSYYLELIRLLFKNPGVEIRRSKPRPRGLHGSPEGTQLLSWAIR